MEWVEVQGKTIDLAVEVALGELGAASREDVKVEVIQEPKAGFLGMGGQEAIVKVTKAPRKRRRSRGRGRGASASKQSGSKQSGSKQAGSKQTNKKQASGKAKQGSNGGKPAQEKSRTGSGQRQEAKVTNDAQDKSAKDSVEERPEQAPIEEQAKVASGFITGLLDAFGLEGNVDTRIDDDVLYLDVTGEQTEALIGPKGSVMQSVLELTRTVVQRKTFGAPRMRIDIAGYGERRREALRIYAGKLSSQVIEERSEIMLEPMNAADRKVLHDAVAEIDGVRSFSEGEEPRRAVVIAYDGDA